MVEASLSSHRSSRAGRASHLIMAVCFSSASLLMRRTAAFCVPSSPLGAAPAWAAQSSSQAQKRPGLPAIGNSNLMLAGARTTPTCPHYSHGSQQWPSMFPVGKSNLAAARPAWPALRLRSGPSPLFATRGYTKGPPSRGRRKQPDDRLMPAERRVLERRRKDGTISPSDLARLSRAERTDRISRTPPPAHRSRTATPAQREYSSPRSSSAPTEAIVEEEERAPRRPKRGRPPWALGEERLRDRDGEDEQQEGSEESEGLRNVHPIASPALVEVPSAAPAGGMLFGGVPCDERTTAGLAAAGIERPLPIQQVAMAELLSGRSAVLHSATGSGKTLTFVLPLLARLQASGSGRLRGLIMAPTRELALQITAQVTALQGQGSSFLLVGGTEEVADQLEQLKTTRAEILVASPDRLLRVLEAEVEELGLAARSAVLGSVETVVVDEVDRMLASLSKYATHAEKKKRARHPKPTMLILQRLLQHHHAHSRPLQLVACSATVGRPMRKDLARLDSAFELKSLPVIVAPPDPDAPPSGDRARQFDSGRGPAAQGAMVPSTILHRFVSVNRAEDKYAVLQHLLVSVCPDRPALLFLADGVSVARMVATMRHSGIARATALHDAMGFANYDQRNTTAGSASGSGGMGELLSSQATLREAMVKEDQAPPLIVMNEQSARGIDLKIDVVFLWEMPFETASYLHMAGRTGRAGRDGVAIMLVGKHEKKRLKTFESHLGIRIKYLQDYSELAGARDDEEE